MWSAVEKLVKSFTSYFTIEGNTNKVEKCIEIDEL